jgi:hypothetical protein
MLAYVTPASGVVLLPVGSASVREEWRKLAVA